MRFYVIPLLTCTFMAVISAGNTKTKSLSRRGFRQLKEDKKRSDGLVDNLDLTCDGLAEAAEKQWTSFCQKCYDEMCPTLAGTILVALNSCPDSKFKTSLKQCSTPAKDVLTSAASPPPPQSETPAPASSPPPQLKTTAPLPFDVEEVVNDAPAVNDALVVKEALPSTAVIEKTEDSTSGPTLPTITTPQVVTQDTMSLDLSEVEGTTVESLASLPPSESTTNGLQSEDLGKIGDVNEVENKTTGDESSSIFVILLATIVAGVLIIICVVWYRQHELLSEMEEEDEYETRQAKMNNGMSMASEDYSIFAGSEAYSSDVSQYSADNFVSLDVSQYSY